ncbi:glycosyltransferase [Bacillus cereus]|uniref:glycosyltransferase n=1 Tax=Bacillus cereus TaxID=1396 RepID=UPI002ADEEB6A|nr:glycosyltransferase [Bacillus cereus]MEA1010164.1 glycosyltransferase [Bacillus cereus]
MLISLIIPVYNAEKFLPRCLESIRNQSYRDLEIILVNDGSTDRSGLICDEYAQKDKRFKVIHKKNGGVSSARNVALSIASGAYIGFVDPDDWIEPIMFEKLHELIQKNQVDIAICGYIRENIDGDILQETVAPSIKVLNRTEALNSILDVNEFRGFLWNKLFSSKLFHENFEIHFDENIHFCEDLLFCCKAILNAENIVYDSTPYYHYIIHDNNASKAKYSLRKLTALDAVENIISLLNIDDVDIKKYKSYYAHMNISLLMHGIQEGNIEEKHYEKLKRNLYHFKVSDLNGSFLKISSVIARINVRLYYFVWKNFKKT